MTFYFPCIRQANFIKPNTKCQKRSEIVGILMVSYWGCSLENSHSGELPARTKCNKSGMCRCCDQQAGRLLGMQSREVFSQVCISNPREDSPHSLSSEAGSCRWSWHLSLVVVIMQCCGCTFLKHLLAAHKITWIYLKNHAFERKKGLEAPIIYAT